MSIPQPVNSRILENKATGYMKLFRSLKIHWLWADEKKLKWWLDILLTVNYSDQKVLLRGELIECKRGQSVRSLETWAKDWRTTKKTVQTFFKLLQKDKMVLLENVKVTTRLTVCNYDSYNSSVNGDDYDKETVTTTDSKRSLPPNNKDNKDNKDKEGKEEIAAMLFDWNLFAEKNNRKKMKSITGDRLQKLKTRFSEKNFNLQNILIIADRSDFIKKGNWFSFDWIVKNDTNYIKVLEGNYNNSDNGQQTTNNIKGHQDVSAMSAFQKFSAVNNATGNS